MKTIIKEKYKKAILALVASSIGMPSCKDEIFEDPLKFRHENFAADNIEGTNMLPINLYLGSDYEEQLLFIDQFVSNILSNENAAVEFRKDPQKNINKV